MCFVSCRFFFRSSLIIPPFTPMASLGASFVPYTSVYVTRAPLPWISMLYVAAVVGVIAGVDDEYCSLTIERHSLVDPLRHRGTNDALFS